MSDGVRLHAWVSRLAPDQPPPGALHDGLVRPRRAAQPLARLQQRLPGDHPGRLRPAVPLEGPHRPLHAGPGLLPRHRLVRGDSSTSPAPRTQQDVHEALDWAARQPWSTGRIVVAGESGTGFAGYHALTDPHVKAAALLMTDVPGHVPLLLPRRQYNSLAEVYLAGTSGGFAAGLVAQALGLNMNPRPAPAGRDRPGRRRHEAHPTDDAFWNAALRPRRA